MEYIVLGIYQNDPQLTLGMQEFLSLGGLEMFGYATWGYVVAWIQQRGLQAQQMWVYIPVPIIRIPQKKGRDDHPQ